MVGLVVFEAGRGAAEGGSTPSGLPVATSGDYRPFTFHDGRGTLTGFDVAVARRLAADLGRRLVFVSFRWPDLVPLLDAPAATRTVEIAMSGVTVRPDRAIRVAY